ncbi:transforming acidic coiled-coil protein [Anaeramoeba flamelloides]|uniref:Transforming acidic coiled-coil protein n=1 Tax=Anaeramoeba flamelloides TaxID=1746091 RepID=A0AAV7ZGN8_9EUKA|nr:transforming acidic coiled-coil protein isoform k [Anaeramoeba flamelloides]KAJ6227095.1 transforming acidic coiled-coil protein [Anaeramoeba flamelloides]
MSKSSRHRVQFLTMRRPSQTQGVTFSSSTTTSDEDEDLDLDQYGELLSTGIEYSDVTYDESDSLSSQTIGIESSEDDSILDEQDKLFEIDEITKEKNQISNYKRGSKKQVTGKKKKNKKNKSEEDEEVNFFEIDFKLDEENQVSLLTKEHEELQIRIYQEKEQTGSLKNLLEKFAKLGDKVSEIETNFFSTTAVGKLDKENRELEKRNEEMEENFIQLNKKYQKLWIEHEQNLQKESQFQQGIQAIQKEIKLSENRFEKLKSYAQQKIEEANVEVVKIKKHLKSINDGYKTDTLKLSTRLNKANNKVQTLRQELETKEKENQELMNICDDLMKKFDGV